MLDEGNLEDKSVPHYLDLIGELYLIENHRHNYGQYLTTPTLLFPNLEHFNCGRKIRLCACLKRQ